MLKYRLSEHRTEEGILVDIADLMLKLNKQDIPILRTLVVTDKEYEEISKLSNIVQFHNDELFLFKLKIVKLKNGQM